MPGSFSQAMHFRVHKPTSYGDRVLLIGSTPALGSWDLSRALPCTWTAGDIWVTDPVPRPPYAAPVRFEFKFCLRTADGRHVWEQGPNHVALLPVHAAATPLLHVQWAIPAIVHVPVHPNRPLLNGLLHSHLSNAASPPPTPSGSADDAATVASDPLSIAVARVTAVVENTSLDPPASVPVKFRIKYRLDPGENIFVVGSIPELGCWNKMHSPPLSALPTGPTDLHEAAMLLPHDQAHEEFEYKYFTRRADGTRRWEAGENRIARPFHVDAPRERDAEITDSKAAVLWDDRWEKIRCEFSIYYPTKNTQVMHVTGDPPQIGAWFKPGPTKMELGPMQVLETDVKGRKWFLNVWTARDQPSFSYRYIIIDEKSKQELWEREPNRRAEYDEKLPVVNSVRIMRDLNFVSEMSFDYVPPDMYIGPYPQSPADVDTMAKGGVTGVFNVQTDEDFKHRGIQWDILMERYDEHNIKVVRYPIRDFDRDSLQARLNGAAHALDDLLESGRKVYIHCTAGMGRAPACAVAYLCWVKNMELMDAVAHVKKYRKVAVPNVPVLQQALKHPY